MKIVQLITHMNEVGGAQVHVRDLSKKLKEEGHSVTVLSGGVNGIDKALWVKDVTYLHSKYLQRNINIVKDLKAFIDLRKKIKMIAPDIVAIHSSKAGIIGRIACWSLNVPFVFTAHGWAFTEGVAKKTQRLYRIIEKYIGKITPKIITVSEYDRNLAIKKKVVHADKIVTILNGIFDNQTKQTDYPIRAVTIVMVARFEKPKKHLELLEEMAKIKDKSWKLVLVGDGSLKKDAIKFAHHEGIDNKVKFLSSGTDVHRILSNADIFVLTSSWEGLPLCILEAMMHGLPIIASNVGGIPEIVRDNGFLIYDNLSEHLNNLLNDDHLRKSMGRKSREIYEKEFTFDRMYEETFSLYSTLIK